MNDQSAAVAFSGSIGTAEEFFRLVEACGLKFVLDFGSEIRASRSQKCPVCELAHALGVGDWGSGQVWEAGKKLGMPDDLLTDIAFAADYTCSILKDREHRLRQRMLTWISKGRTPQ